MLNRQRAVKLQILMKGLEVYLVGGSVGWNRHASRLFQASDGNYTLTLEAAKGDQFKCFVHINIGQDPIKVREALERAGVIITGEGDIDPQSKQPRLWFLIPGTKTSGEGVWANMLWVNEDEIVFPKSKDDQTKGKQKVRPDSPPPKKLE